MHNIFRAPRTDAQKPAIDRLSSKARKNTKTIPVETVGGSAGQKTDHGTWRPSRWNKVFFAMFSVGWFHRSERMSHKVSFLNWPASYGHGSLSRSFPVPRALGQGLTPVKRANYSDQTATGGLCYCIPRLQNTWGDRTEPQNPTQTNKPRQVFGTLGPPKPWKMNVLVLGPSNMGYKL